jgi:hypothetical protein
MDTYIMRGSLSFQVYPPKFNVHLSFFSCTFHISRPLLSLDFLTQFVLNEDYQYLVIIGTRYGLDCRGIKSRWGERFSVPVYTGLGAHPASYTVGNGSLSRG